MDQLAQLKDIHLPEQVHNWPIAIGWWILVILIIAIMMIIVKKTRAHRKKHVVKKHVSKQLTTNDNLSTEQILSLLKWTCMHYFNRQEVASIHSNALVSYLAEKLSDENQKEFTDKAANAITQCYRKSETDIYAKEFQQAAIFWINNANLFPSIESPAGGKV